MLLTALLRHSAVTVRPTSPLLEVPDSGSTDPAAYRERSSSSPPDVLADRAEAASASHHHNHRHHHRGHHQHHKMAGSPMDSATAAASISNANMVKQGWLQKRGMLLLQTDMYLDNFVVIHLESVGKKRKCSFMNEVLGVVV